MITTLLAIQAVALRSTGGTIYRLPFLAQAMSLDGSTVVGMTEQLQPCVWTPETGMHLLFKDPSVKGIAQGVSADGQIFGGQLTSFYRPVFLIHPGHTEFYDPNPGGVVYVNPDGDSLTVAVPITTKIKARGALWTSAHGFEAILRGFCPSGVGNGSYYTGEISDRSTSPLRITNTTAAILKNGTALKILGSFDNYPNTVATGGNEDGSVICGCAFDQGRSSAWIWSEGTGFSLLPNGNASYAAAVGMTKDGRMVVGTGLEGAVVWIDGKRVSLEAFLRQHEVRTKGFDPGAFVGVSADGNCFFGHSKSAGLTNDWYVRLNKSK